MVTVTITKQDIEKGIPRNCWECPVALALWRATGMKWVVGSEHAYPLAGPLEMIWFSEPVCNWIHNYDQKKYAEPFSFQL